MIDSSQWIVTVVTLFHIPRNVGLLRPRTRSLKLETGVGTFWQEKMLPRCCAAALTPVEPFGLLFARLRERDSNTLASQQV